MSTTLEWPTEITSWRWKRYQEHRDSGIKWLGSIPEHWKIERLKYTSTMNPEALAEDTNPDYRLRYVDIGNVTSLGEIAEIQEMSFESAPSRARRIVRSGDTMISTVRTYLKAIGFIQQEAENLIVSTGFAVLRPTFKVLPEFLYLLVQSSVFVDAVVANSEGVGYPAINPGKLATLATWIPPLDEQRAIIQFLGRETAKIDALVTKKGRLIELLEEKRTALISHVVTKGLDPTVPMKNSDIEWLGKTPAHWKVMRLKYAISRAVGAIKTGPFGSQLVAEDMQGSDVKVYNQRNVIHRDAHAGNNYISTEKYRSLSSFTVRPGDILLTTRGTIGRSFFLLEDAEVGVLHPCLMRIKPNLKVLLPELLELLIQESGLIQSQLFFLSDATTIEVIYSDTIRRLIIPVPPVSEQHAILYWLNSELLKIDALNVKIQEGIDRLKEYRTALISAAVTGKINVRREVSRATSKSSK